MFKGVSRLDTNEVAIRKVNIKVSNANFDDGLPPSLLREISYLNFIE